MCIRPMILSLVMCSPEGDTLHTLTNNNSMNEEFTQLGQLDTADVFLQSEPTWEDDIPTPSDDYIMDNDFDDNF